METRSLEEFRLLLSQHREELLEWLDSEPRQKEVCLCDSPESETESVISQLQQALESINSGSFGQCSQCEGEVEEDRLKLDCTTSVCLSHYTEAEIEALERDLELAAKVQKLLLPSCVPALYNIDIAFHAEAANIVSGDYYDFFVYNDGTQGVAIADVMGKGLPASMLMSNLQASLRILGPDYSTPDAVAVHLNKLFCNNSKLISFISVFLAAVDVERGIVTYCNAGHHPPILWQESTQTIRWLEPTGPAIGLTPGPVFKSNAIRFESGDLLLLYTDGLVEAKNGNGEEFGEARLASHLKENRNNGADKFLVSLLEKARQCRLHNLPHR